MKNSILFPVIVNLHHPFTVIPHNKPHLVFRIQQSAWSNLINADLVSEANKQRLTIHLLTENMHMHVG